MIRKGTNDPTARVESPSRRSQQRGKNGQVTVRPFNESDFEFIRNLATKTEGYTVCPPYILWVLSRFQPQLCGIAEEIGRGSVGYLLALPVAIDCEAVFVWQLASTFRGRRLDAPAKLLKYLISGMRKHGIETLFFTTIPNSKAERDVRALAQRVFAASPIRGTPVPREASHGEHEYRVQLPRERR